MSVSAPATDTEHTRALRERMVTGLVDSGAITDDAWRRAFTAVARHALVPRFYRTHDRALIDSANPDDQATWLDGAANAPYDAILATCALRRIPACWLAQAAPVARIVAPLATGLIALEVNDLDHTSGRFLMPGGFFMPLRDTARALLRGHGLQADAPLGVRLPSASRGWVVADHAHRYHAGVTSREKLLQLIESLPEEQADELLRLAMERYALPGQRQPLPAFVGIGDSGRSDVSERVDDLLANGFGSA